MGITETDAKYHKRDLNEAMKGYDGKMLIDFFTSQKQKDHLFFYDFEQDDDGRFSQCICVDGIARMNYEEFGDVVFFDASYSTNRFGMLFVPFVGINYHRQLVFLGCGFIPNEKASSFVWLFEKWLGVMKRAPSGMVTDKDRGIGVAIQKVFPRTLQIYCIWHILDKLPQEVHITNQPDKFSEAFKSNIWNSYFMDDFESRWKSLQMEYEVENNKWLNDLSQIRKKWAPIYARSEFWTDMLSSQRSEGMHSFLKLHTQKKYLYMNFL